MHFEITISDPDRKLDFTLALDCNYRRRIRPRYGWRDGGDAGEPASVEIDRARCLEIVTWCGKTGVSAVPGLASDPCLESQVGIWCLEQYGDEIERAVLEEVEARRRLIAV
jgi:hypothetical protein